MTILRNPAAWSSGPGPAPGPEPLAFHRRLPGYRPTPLVDITTVTRAASVPVGQVLVKTESDRLGLPSFKPLGASWAIYRALSARLGHRPPPWRDVRDLGRGFGELGPIALSAATDGNYGRAVARMAALLGLPARIVLPAATASARIRAIQDEGADVECVDGSFDDAVVRAAELAAEDYLVVSDTSRSADQRVPGWVIDGYATILDEIEDAGREHGWPAPDVLVVPVGVGALAAAAVRHYADYPAAGRPLIVGVEPEDAACVQASMRAGRIVQLPGPHRSIMAGLNCGTPSAAAWPDLCRGLGAMVSISDDRARSAMRMLAGAGLVAGETGAAALGGLLEIAEHSPGLLGIPSEQTRVLVLVTEGATDPVGYERVVGRPGAPNGR